MAAEQQDLVRAMTEGLRDIGRQFTAHRLDHFDGSQNIHDFLADFDRYIRDTKRNNNQEKLDCLIFYLSGEAKIWFRLQTDDIKDSYQLLRLATTSRFQQTDTELHSRKSALYSAKQGAAQTLKSLPLIYKSVPVVWS